MRDFFLALRCGLYIVVVFSADPFLWADLQMAKVPFSDDTIYVVLDKLKDDDWVQDLVNDLRNVFKVRKKMGKGSITNLQAQVTTCKKKMAAYWGGLI